MTSELTPMRKILVLGASGLIGRFVTDDLRIRGFDVVGVARKFSAGQRTNASDLEMPIQPMASIALARLPASAWPYGRAVAILVDEGPTASEADKIAIRRSRGIVAGDLEGAQVAIDWISSP